MLKNGDYVLSLSVTWKGVKFIPSDRWAYQNKKLKINYLNNIEQGLFSKDFYIGKMTPYFMNAKKEKSSEVTI